MVRVLWGTSHMIHWLTKRHEYQPHPHLNPLPEGEETDIFLTPLQGEGRGGDGVKGFFGIDYDH